MATNNFKPFATGNGANVTSQAEYEALAALLSGFQSGKASSAQINKALRQSTFIASVLAQFISDKANVDVLDNGNATTLMNNLVAALKANSAADFFQRSNNLSEIASTGTAAQIAAAQLSARTNIGLSGVLTPTSSASGAFSQLSAPSGQIQLFISNDGNWGVRNASTGAATALPINRGGTGALTAVDARTNLGLGSSSTRSVGTGDSQIPDMSSFGISLQNPGWAKLPSGLVIQWGNTPIGSTTRSITFAIPFPTSVICVNHFDAGWSTASSGSKWGATNKTSTGFTGNTDTAGEGGQYLALGY